MQRLPTRGGADVRDALARTGVEDADHERRGMVLDGEPPFPEAGKGGGIPSVEQDAIRIERRWPRVAAIVAQRLDQRADLDPGAVRTDAESPPLRERCGRGLGLVADQMPELPHRPGREPGAQAHGVLAVALRRRRRVVRQPAEDGVHEAALPGADEPDGFADGRVRRYRGVRDLVCTQPHRVPRSRGHAGDGSARASFDRVIEGDAAPERPVRELRGERPIPPVQPRAPEQRRHQQVRVRPLLDHPPDRLECNGARRWPRPWVHPSRSSPSNLAPRAHADAAIRLRPAGATSTSRTPPCPLATRTPRWSVPTTIPGTSRRDAS